MCVILPEENLLLMKLCAAVMLTTVLGSKSSLYINIWKNMSLPSAYLKKQNIYILQQCCAVLYCPSSC